jgi:hypothetical protein
LAGLSKEAGMPQKRWSLMNSEERLRDWLHERRNKDAGLSSYDPGTFEQYSEARSGEERSMKHVNDIRELLRSSVGKTVHVKMADGSQHSGVLDAEGTHTIFLRMAGQSRPHQISADGIVDVTVG